MVKSAWPVLDLWCARKLPAEEVKVELQNRPQTVIVFRRGIEVYCDLLNPQQSLLFEGLKAGCSLGEVCDQLSERFPNEEIPVAEWFSLWMRQGLIASCNLIETSVSHQN